MAAQEAVTLENHVRLFVETKLGEKVYVEFHTGCVSIRPISKHGSMTLATFWMRVIQNYFPKSDHVYKKRYSSAMASEALVVNVADVTITVYLRTGLLTFEGDFIHNWFKLNFRQIMMEYDKMTHSSTVDYFSDQVIFDTRKELQQKERRYTVESDQNELIDEHLAMVSTDVRLPQHKTQFLLQKNLEFPETSRHIAHTEKSSGGVMGSITLKDAERYIYPMWKQLLNKWLCNESCQVYIATASVDTVRLKDIVCIAYKNRLVSKLEAIYTEMVGTDGQKMAKVRENLLQGHSTDQQLFIEYKVFNKIKFPATKQVGCNFIAGVDNSGAFTEVMLTSATFDSKAFDGPNCLHSVVFSKMLTEEFRANFLDKLATV